MIRRVSCHHCQMKCREVYRAGDGRYCGLKCGVYAKPMIAMHLFDGPSCTEFYNLCEKYGLDYQGPVNLIAFAIDLYEKGILTKEDTDGMSLKYGNLDVALSLVRKIAFREGIGDILADGLYRAARRIGRGAEQYAVTTKKLEVRNEWRFYNPGHALSGAVGDKVDTDRMGTVLPFDSNVPNGDRQAYVKSEFWGHPKELEEYFLKGWDADGPNYEARCRIFSYSDEQYTICDALGICQWWTGKWGIPPPITGRAMFAELLSYVTGLDMDESELTKIAMRNVNLIRSYNVREGLRRKDDTIPEYAFSMEPPAYLVQLMRRDIQKMDRDLFNKQIDLWYRLKGWDRDGIPTKETLEKLGLEFVYLELKKRGLIAVETPERDRDAV
jgi:aldehyde:ferredoxin oxidoreductase